jgi:hypothetical protein
MGYDYEFLTENKGEVEIDKLLEAIERVEDFRGAVACQKHGGLDQRRNVDLCQSVIEQAHNTLNAYLLVMIRELQTALKSWADTPPEETDRHCLEPLFVAAGASIDLDAKPLTANQVKQMFAAKDEAAAKMSRSICGEGGG